MTKSDLIHHIGWRLVKITYWLATHLRLPFMDWNLALHDWMEKNHACCTRHGYRKDAPPR